MQRRSGSVYLNRGYAILLIFLVLAHFAGLAAANPKDVNLPGEPKTPTDEKIEELAIKKLTKENVKSYTIVLKKNITENISKEIHGKFMKLYENKWKEVTTKDGKQVKILEMKVSKLVKNIEGQYMFKVAESLDVIERILAPYKDSVEAVISKPVPELMDREPPAWLSELQRSIHPTNYEVRTLIGVSRAQAVYGVRGAGINIAIVDTGVDYGHPDLTTSLVYFSGVYKGVSIREPLVFDADQSQVLLLQDVYFYNSTHINVGGRAYITLTPYPVGIYPPYDYYRIPSWVYRDIDRLKFGVTYMLTPQGVEIIGVLLVKYKGENVFRIGIVDVNNNGNFADEPTPPGDPYARGSIIRYYANRVIAPDYNRNGFPDKSLGVAGGFFYDWWWWFSYPAEIHPGWDLMGGNWLSIFYDFDGHGTACASAAAGRGVVSYNGKRLTGMAPGAGIIGVKALWLGNVEVGMLWAAGFDVDSYTGSFYYTGSRRAHIISNSWGISYMTYDIGGFGYDYMSMFITALSLPGFLNSSYPGILVVQAAGNGGPGYGTVTAPGAAPTVLTVGASTSMHMYGRTNLWERDDIISWSARGPTIIGYVKPDVVNVGAHGFTASLVAWNYTLFGGTSYATPLTAGVAALVLQVLGGSADPAIVKSIIMSTASTLSHDPASQGAGRVDAFNSVSLARLLRNQTSAAYAYTVTSTSLASAYASKASSLWYWQWCDSIRKTLLYYFGTDLPLAKCELPSWFASRIDSNLFFGDVAQGSSASIQVTVHNPTNKTMSITLARRKFTLKSSTTINRSITLGPYDANVRTRVLITGSNVTSATFLEVVASMPYTSLDADNDYLPEMSLLLLISKWKDYNGNKVIEDNETILMNYAAEAVNWAYVTVRLPHSRLTGFDGLVIDVYAMRGWDMPGGVNRTTTVTVTLNYITVAGDTWVSAPSSIVVSPRSSATFTVRVTVPANAIPTTYTGFLSLTDNVTRVERWVPYAFNVFTSVNSSFYSLVRGVYDRWPNATWVRGANSWVWRYESGDWRVFFVKPSLSGLAWELEASWTHPNTSLITYTFGPDGQFAGAYYGQSVSWGDAFYLGGGTFAWTGTGAGSIQNAKRVVTFPALQYRVYLYPHSKPESGVFTFVVRTTLFDGSGGFREPIAVRTRVLPARQLLPAITRSGELQYLRFSLPYVLLYMDAWATRPYTPYLDFDQRYTEGYVSISPTYVSGPYPANTVLTFTVRAYHYGATWQKFDAVAIFQARLTSLTNYYRYYGRFRMISDIYRFEDWTSVVRQ